MITTIIFIAAFVIALVAWLLWLRGRTRNALAQQDAIRRDLHALESERQSLINEAGQRGVTISTDKALKHVEGLKVSYLQSGNDVAAEAVDRIITKFRQENGPEIPIEKAYALMRELEAKHGPS